MPKKNGHMTGQESRFVDAMVKTGDLTYSATVAGYQHARSNGHAIAKRPAVDQEIRARTMAMLHNEGVPLAVGTLMNIASNEKAPWNSRVAASKEILAAAHRDTEQETSGKEAHEMTGEELLARLQAATAQVQALETIKADRARPIVDHEPLDDAQEGDIFG